MMGRVEQPDDWEPRDPPCPEVVVTDNPIIGRLYGPKGETLIELRERPTIGFRS